MGVWEGLTLNVPSGKVGGKAETGLPCRGNSLCKGNML